MEDYQFQLYSRQFPFLWGALGVEGRIVDPAFIDVSVMRADRDFFQRFLSSPSDESAEFWAYLTNGTGRAHVLRRIIPQGDRLYPKEVLAVEFNDFALQNFVVVTKHHSRRIVQILKSPASLTFHNLLE